MEQNSAPEDESKTYSIALHLQRVVTEDAYVAVPVTAAIITANADGTGSIDYEAFVAEAIRISQSEGVDWKVEETRIEPHPVQSPLPEGRQMFDPYRSTPDTAE